MAESRRDSPQVFRPRSNSLMRTGIFGACFLLAVSGGITWGVWWSPYMTRQNVPINQPVPFSHKHHVNGLGLDCRYCHVTVEHSSFAGMPPTETCMTCHSRVWTEAPVLAPVRQSWRMKRPLHWNRVYNTPAFVFFNHGAHIQNGIGCSTCHGPVQDMPMTWKAHAMWMRWCTDCHSNPKPYLRPQSQIFNMNWKAGANQNEDGEKLMKFYNIRTNSLTDCSVCHR